MDLSVIAAALNNPSPRVVLMINDGDGKTLAVIPVRQPVVAVVTNGVINLHAGPVMVEQSGAASQAILMTENSETWASVGVSIPNVYAGGTLSVSDLSVDDAGLLKLNIGYDATVSRPLARSVCNLFHDGRPVLLKTDIDCDAGVSNDVLHCLPHRHGIVINIKRCYDLYKAITVYRQSCSAYQLGMLASEKSCTGYMQARNIKYRTYDQYQHAVFYSDKACSGFFQSATIEPKRWCDGFEQAVFINSKSCSLFKSSIRLELKNCAPYQHGLPIPCHASVDEDPNNPDNPPIDEPNTPITPKKYGTVFIVNDFALIDPETGMNIPCLSASVQTDKNSYAWQFRLSLPYNATESVQGRLKELEVRINGYIWRMVVTGRGKGEQFGQTTIELTGSSPTVLLSDPYAPTRSVVVNESSIAKSLAESELERAGLSTGFALDWRLTDSLAWQIPAGSFGYDNLAPIQAIKKLAEAGGGWLYSDMSRREISVRPIYPTPFWQWSKPDILIPGSLILDRRADYREEPLHDGVYVSGTNQGVTAFVRRAGTAGANQAPMVSDDLITDEAAARQRGLSVLSAGGKIMDVSMTVPLHKDIGVVLPNTLVGVSDWLGLSAKVSIDVSWQNSLKIRQKIGIERHLDK